MKKKTNPAKYDQVLRRQLEQLRIRGFAGGIISKHRSMLTLPLRPARIAVSMIMSVSILLIWLFILNDVSHGWTSIMDFWRDVLGLGGYVVTSRYPITDILYLDVPHVHTGAAGLTPQIWWSGMVLCVLMGVVSFYVPRRQLPLAYFLRVLIFFQLFAQVFFAVAPGAFPYSVAGYIEVMMLAGLMLISLVPIVLGFTYYVFDFTITKKVLLTLMVMLHLGLLIPMQFMAHAYIMHHFSLLFMPMLFLGFGLPANVLVFIAFYSWAVSWDALHDQKDLQMLDLRSR
ncbi:MAG: hypothetical protein GY835_10430 [bacterium]|nr:hypothetical protein [bacterium]